MKKFKVYYLKRAKPFEMFKEGNSYREQGKVEKSKIIYSKTKELARDKFRVNYNRPITKVEEIK